MNKENTPLRSHYDSRLQNDRRHVYTCKVDKEIGCRSKQTSQIVTQTQAWNKGTRNPIGMSHVVPTDICMPTMTRSTKDSATL
jgi:hypothetical protein